MALNFVLIKWLKPPGSENLTVEVMTSPPPRWTAQFLPPITPMPTAWLRTHGKSRSSFSKALKR